VREKESKESLLLLIADGKAEACGGRLSATREARCWCVIKCQYQSVINCMTIAHNTYCFPVPKKIL